MTNTTQSCNACDTVDYDGELDDAGRCAQCVAEEREFVAHHNGGHTTAQCEQGQHDFQFPVDSYGVPMTTARYCSNCDTIESEPIMTTTTAPIIIEAYQDEDPMSDRGFYSYTTRDGHVLSNHGPFRTMLAAQNAASAFASHDFSHTCWSGDPQCSTCGLTKPEFNRIKNVTDSRCVVTV